MNLQYTLPDPIYDGDIAYRKIDGRTPGIFFLHGYASDMDGTKSEYLAQWAQDNGQAMLRFDMRGNGLSQGHFDDFTLQDWLDDACHMFEHHTSGPQIIVGSSMGGWLAFHLAMRFPKRVKAIIGIAAAPDFVKKIPINGTKTDAGYILESGLTFTDRLLEMGDSLCILSGTIEIDCPVMLLQGKLDDSVPWETAELIKSRLKPNQCEILYVDDADHRFSSPKDLETLKKAVKTASL